mmetsp:Transcript_136828/g.425025  ORF Transcript_136828/g.425025 Transcript_136828/m.425025 type:complete len:259 (-) Transcript_136828:157-933(-)
MLRLELMTESDDQPATHANGDSNGLELDQEVAALRHMQKNTFIHITPPDIGHAARRTRSAPPSSSSNDSSDDDRHNDSNSSRLDRDLDRVLEPGGAACREQPGDSGDSSTSDDATAKVDADVAKRPKRPNRLAKRPPKKKRARIRAFLKWAKGTLAENPTIEPTDLEPPDFMQRDEHARETAQMELEAYVRSLRGAGWQPRAKRKASKDESHFQPFPKRAAFADSARAPQPAARYSAGQASSSSAPYQPELIRAKMSL